MKDTKWTYSKIKDQTNRIRPNPPNILNRTLQPMKHARPSSAAARDGGWLDAGSIQVVRCDGQLGSVPNLSKSPVRGEIGPPPPHTTGRSPFPPLSAKAAQLPFPSPTSSPASPPLPHQRPLHSASLPLYIACRCLSLLHMTQCASSFAST